jgi:hypothetical protein
MIKLNASHRVSEFLQSHYAAYCFSISMMDLMWSKVKREISIGQSTMQKQETSNYL